MVEEFQPEDSYVAQNGYVNWKIGGKWQSAHRFVMESHLERKLYPGERVTFKDGNRQNLDIDNLRLISRGKTDREERIAYLEEVIENAKQELAELNEQQSEG